MGLIGGRLWGGKETIYGVIGGRLWGKKPLYWCIGGRLWGKETFYGVFSDKTNIVLSEK